MINYSFSELVDIVELRSLCKQFTQVTGFATAILDMEGNVLVKTGWQEICTCFHRSAPVTALRCRESDTVLADRLREGEEYSVYRCRNGLIDVAIPIVIDGKPVGRLYSGQFLFEPPDMEFFRRQAEEFGFDETSYLDAVKQLPVVTEDQAKQVMGFLGRLAEMIGRMGLTNRRVDDAVMIVKDSPAMLFRCKATEGWPVQYVSDNVIQFGYEPEVLMSGNFMYSSLVHADDMERIASEVSEYSCHGVDRFHLEYRIVTRDGEVRWVDERATAERNAEGEIVHYRGVVLDISEAKKAEEALRENEEQLKMAMDLAKLAKWEYDVATGMFFYDDQFYSLYGTTTEREGGPLMSAEAYARKFLPPEESPLVAAEIEKTLSIGHPKFTSQLEHRIIRADGEERFITVRYTVVCDRTGRVIKIRGVNQDITERRKAELEIRESNERFRVVFDTIPDYISISTIEDGVFVDVNPGFTEIVGYTRDGVVGKSALGLNLWIDPGDRQKLLDAIRQNGFVNNLENKIRHKDGHIIDVSMYGSIIKLNNKPYMFVFLKDVTEYKKAVESLSRLNRTLRTLSKCNEILVRTENEPDLLREVCRVIVEDGGYRFAWVAYAEHDRERTVRPVAHAGHEEGYLEKLNLSWAETEAGMGPSTVAIRTGQPAYVKDIETDPAFAIWRDEARKRGYRSSLAIPLVSSEQPGSLNIYAAETDAFDAAEIELMVQLANDLAYGIKSLRTRVKHRQASEALYKSAEEYRKLAVVRAQEKNLLRALIDSIPDLIFFKGQASVFLGCNKAFEAFAGRTEEELIGLTDLDMFPREVGEFFRKMDHQMMSERKARTNEEWVDYPDGHHAFLETLKTPYYDKDGAVLGLIGISRDITGRKQAEDRLQGQLLFMQQLLETIPIPVFYKDADGNYLGCNSAYERFIGLPENKLLGKTVYDLAPRDLADIYQEADATLFRQPGIQVYETSVMHKDSTRHDVIFNKATYVDADGRVVGIVGAIMDISQLRKSEDERKLLETQLLQAQKMEAIGQLAGGIAHDFNNILTAIIGYAELLSMRIGKESPLRHYIEQVLASSDRAVDLVNGLLAFSRKQVLKPKPVDLCDIFRVLKKMLGRIIREDIDFRTTVFDRALIVMADKGQIEQVLMNLVTNARDAMAHGGTLSIDVSPAFIDEEFVHVHGYGLPGHYACISVSDTGCGMDEETKKKIFEPFFTTKEVGKGTGLGMAIIYGIVKQHNGYINVCSELGNGTTFNVYLPLLAEESKAEHAVQVKESFQGGTETILLVEDDSTVRELHKMLLEEAGYTVIEACDGHDALAKFMKSQSVIDMLATDVIMPLIDGKSLYQEIVKYRSGMKVLFMSGYTKDIVIGKGIPDHDSNFITKPLTPSKLLAKVREILDERKE